MRSNGHRQATAHELATLAEQARLEGIDGDFLTASEVAEMTGYHRSHIHLLVREGKLSHRRLGRLVQIPRAAAERLAKQANPYGTRAKEVAREVPKVIDTGRLLTVKEVAKRLGVSTATVDVWRSTEGLPHIKLGKIYRYPEKPFDLWLASRYHAGADF